MLNIILDTLTFMERVLNTIKKKQLNGFLVVSIHFHMNSVTFTYPFFSFQFSLTVAANHENIDAQRKLAALYRGAPYKYRLPGGAYSKASIPEDSQKSYFWFENQFFFFN